MLAHQKIPNPQSLSFWQTLTNFVKDKCFAFLKIEVKICTFCWLEIKEEDQEKISQQEDTQRRTKGSCFEEKNTIKAGGSTAICKMLTGWMGDGVDTP